MYAFTFSSSTYFDLYSHLHTFYISGTNDRIQVQVYIAPPGEKMVPENGLPGQNWSKTAVTIKMRESEKVIVGSNCTYGWREQLPIVPFGTTTIHKALGLTCDAIATKISGFPQQRYALWQHEQLLVLLSRVKFMSNLWFVGEPRETPRQVKSNALIAMKSVLNCNSHRASYVEQMLQHLDYFETPQDPIIQRPPPLPWIQHQLPEDGGICYMLYSMRNPTLGYVGQTHKMKRRLLRHNKGGSDQTRDNAPWVPALLISGFGDNAEDNYRNRLAFETQWHNANKSTTNRTTNAAIMFENGVRQVYEWQGRRIRLPDGTTKLQFPDLNYVHMIDFTQNHNTMRGKFYYKASSKNNVNGSIIHTVHLYIPGDTRSIDDIDFEIGDDLEILNAADDFDEVMVQTS